MFPGDLDGLGCNLASFLALKPISDQDRGEVQHHGAADPLLSLVEIKNWWPYPACSVPIIAGGKATETGRSVSSRQEAK